MTVNLRNPLPAGYNQGMRYRLRTLLIVLAILPPLPGMGWWGYRKWLAARQSSIMRIISAEHNIMQPTR